MLAAMCDGFGRSYLECGPAQGGCISADHEANANRRGASARTWLGVDIENIDPVAWPGRLVVQQSPGAIRLLVQFWCTKEGLPGVPYWLRQRQGASDRCLSFGYLELEGDLVERPLENIGDIRAFDFPACPLRVLCELVREASLCRSRAL